VASYDDVVKALDDGRMERILKEYERYEKEYKNRMLPCLGLMDNVSFPKSIVDKSNSLAN
jgi:hypothetical protein